MTYFKHLQSQHALNERWAEERAVSLLKLLGQQGCVTQKHITRAIVLLGQ